MFLADYVGSDLCSEAGKVLDNFLEGGTSALKKDLDILYKTESRGLLTVF